MWGSQVHHKNSIEQISGHAGQVSRKAGDEQICNGATEAPVPLLVLPSAQSLSSDFKLCLQNTQDSDILISVCMVVQQLPMQDAFACMNQPLGRRHAAKATVNIVGWQQWTAPVEASR